MHESGSRYLLSLGKKINEPIAKGQSSTGHLSETRVSPSAPICATPGKLEGGLGFFGPVALPRPIVLRVNREITQAVFAPDVRSRLEESGFRVSASTPEQFSSALKESLESFGRAVKLAGVKTE
jgi:hypothetical protein